MPGIRITEKDSPEVSVRRFRKICERANILKRLREIEFYEKPSKRRRREVAAARRRAERKALRDRDGS